MGCIQLCGKQSEKPYYIEIADLNVYSLEEINYFICNYIDKVYRDFFCEPLFSYIDKELGRHDMAVELRKMSKNGARVQSFIKYIFKESYYYSGSDVMGISETIERIDNLSQSERYKIEAQLHEAKGRLQSALRIYLRILNDMDTKEDGNKFYAKVAYSVGVIYSRLFMCRQANRYFEYAYELYPEADYLLAAAYSSVIDHDDEELLRLINRYQLTDAELSGVHKKVNALREKIKNGAEIAGLAGKEEKYIEKWRAEYYNMLS